jgi:2TM domain
MNTEPVTLDEYEKAQRALAHESATTGVVVHGIVTLLVSAALIVINVTLAPEFPWSAFAVGGMLLGLLAHWWFGYVRLDDQLTRQQQEAEVRAAAMR